MLSDEVTVECEIHIKESELREIVNLLAISEELVDMLIKECKGDSIREKSWAGTLSHFRMRIQRALAVSESITGWEKTVNILKFN